MQRVIPQELQLSLYLDEKKVQLKEDKTNPDIISYGFGEYRIIQDYPIRGRATYLHVRKRKWLDKSSNEIFSYDWDLSEFDGTRLNSEFVSFLKAYMKDILLIKSKNTTENQQFILCYQLCFVSDSVAIRTQDPRLRRALLYPAELRNHP